jgi:hypothetical protein
VKHHPSVEPFARRPWLSVVLALGALCMGALFWLNLLPSALKYGPYHGVIMAALCAGLAAFFGYCAWRGLGD